MGGSLVFSNTRIIQFRVLIFFGKKKKAIPFALFFFSFFYFLLRARISSRGAQRARLHTHTKREREKRRRRRSTERTRLSLFSYFLFFSASFRRVEDESRAEFCVQKKRERSPFFLSSAFLNLNLYSKERVALDKKYRNSREQRRENEEKRVVVVVSGGNSRVVLHIIMACAKQAAEAEQLGGKLLQLCRKKAPEKELLRVLEVRHFKNHIHRFLRPKLSHL